LDWVDRWAELEASDNLFALVVMAQLRAKLSREGENRRKWKYRLLQSLYDRGCDRETIQQLFRVIDWMIRLPEELERQLLTDIYRLEEERHMPYVTSAERFGMERGHALGMEKGRQEGLRQGEATILLRQIELKFGAAAARAHRARIESADIDSLQQWSERILSAQAVDELFV
jgi:predicted transposase YdaD